MEAQAKIKEKISERRAQMDSHNLKVEKRKTRTEQKNVMFQKASQNFMVLNRKTMQKVDEKSADVGSFVTRQLARVPRTKNLPF